MPRILIAVLTMILAMSGLLGGAQGAAAAPTVTYPGAVSGITLEKHSGTGPLGQWQSVRITGDWEVPVGAVAGETFGLTLPSEFSRQAAGAFAITDPATGAVVAECAVGTGPGPDAVCTLTSAVDGLEDVGGTFWMEARATTATTSATVRFDLGDTVEFVDLPGEGGIIPEDLTEEKSPYKFGGTTATEGRLRWVVGIPSSSVRDGALTVSDSLDPARENHHYTRELRLHQRPVENGVLVGQWTPVNPDRWDVVFADDDKSFEFEASGLPASGFAYELVYFTRADGVVLAGDVFGNRAIVDSVTTTSTHTITENGGGSGNGVSYARFAVTKQLTGVMADRARDATFTVRYSIKGSDAEPRTLSVKVGQPVLSDRIPLGATFVVEEIQLPPIAGVVWGAWTLGGDGVVKTQDGRYEVTPTSTAAVQLTLTNLATVLQDEAPTPDPTPEPAPSDSVTPSAATGSTVTAPTPAAEAAESGAGLALTGGEVGLGAVSLALALILAGAVASTVAARRRAG